ncbi:MAG: putative metal-binding motif-containing protein [Myxococcota bacterium]
MMPRQIQAPPGLRRNDNDCDTTTPVDELDGDRDFFVACSGWNDTQGDNSGILGGGDCDPSSDVTWPGATERCDNADNNCNVTIDDGTGASCACVNGAAPPSVEVCDNRHRQ